MPIDSSQLMLIARLKKPYGIKGWLWVFSETEDRTAIFEMKPWYIKTATGFKPLTPTNWRTQGAGIVASFDEIPDRNVAETMNGATIWITKDNLPKPADDEYYWSDLLDLRVINEQNELLGVVKNLFETGANDVITVTPTKDSIDGEERLIPWHKTTVLEVLLRDGVLRVDWQKDY